jgi:dephospho-CoA kinase
MFAARGAAVVDADRLGHALQEPGAACYAPLVAAFGPEVMDATGRIDRRRLGALVFADPEARRTLDEIMRPAIWSDIAANVDEARAAGVRLCVVEAAILLEAGWQEQMQAVVTVTAPKAVQVERLRASRGLSDTDARARVAALWSNADKVARADFVIDNGGERAATEAQVDRIVGALLEREARGEGREKA